MDPGSTVHPAVMQRFRQSLVFGERRLARPGADEVLIRVEACNLCHSDLHIVDGDTSGYHEWPACVRPAP